MKINKSTIEILKLFSSINPSILIQPGNYINTRTADGNIYAEATVEDTFEHKICLYAMDQLLGVINNFKGEMEMTVDNKDDDLKLNLKHESGAKATLIMSQESLIVYPKKPIVFPAAQIEFDLKADDISRLQAMGNTLKLNMLKFIKEDGKIVARLFYVDKSGGVSEQESNQFDVVIGETEYAGDFDLRFDMKHLSYLTGDTSVKCIRGAAQFKCPQVTYVISMNKASTLS
ncbi:sliding clamp protein [Aeromonas phage AS-yj]|uniref:Sliding clamp n=7 Tax=Caudoviricetes TaxID=2731619 RepID=A0A291LDS2_9CAUD|nr:DNA polymerase processivity factor [Aeromonas phage CC2]YP_009834335.1 DNA polymerase processivity factor [Aeromonas phage AS-zj]YP_009834966.1 DNA polymerase processivity factor [Aeromonas phage AS-sw]ATI17480.1 sliding clamp protein [Aeromonas phage AS-szw]ATI18031.1 sliding clamp protein [Aeromonas phage AS-yj]QAX97920.1 sliding clamp [Aeromonas phage Asswx_1]QAX99029.1 sliding clamp [Aeromonas phage Assk]QMV28809.1 DNA polymerase processivity component [Aeromonas phage AP1]UKM62548.1